MPQSTRIQNHDQTPVARRAAIGLAFVAAGCAAAATGRQGEAGPALPPISPNRPTFSDGTGLVPVGHAQVETGYTFTKRSQSGVESQRSNAPEVVGRFRASDSLEVRLAWGGYAWSETDQGVGTDHDDGSTDPAVGIVVPVADQSGWQPAIAIEAATTLGVGDESFSSGHADPTLKLLWSYGGGSLPDWLGVGGNLNVSYPTEAGDRFTQTSASLYTTFGLAGGDTTVFAEWYVIGRPANGVESSQSCDFGVVQRLSDRIAVDARAGFGLDDRADDFFAGVGISFLF